MKKKIFYWFIILLLVIFLFFYQKEIFFAKEENFLAVSFLDVGQGDASLIEVGDGKKILIDAGPDNLILRRLGEELNFFERHIDFLIISHFHDDHVTGVIEIFRRYQVGNLIFADGLEQTELSKAIITEANKQGVLIFVLKKTIQLEISDQCFLDLLNPLALGASPNSNNSLIAKLDCYDKKFLFAGDNEAAVEKMLLKSNWDIEADFFKASHHGSKTSNLEAFLVKVKPEVMVISVGEDNRFNHPSDETLKTANKLGIDVWRTDQQSTINILANIK